MPILMPHDTRAALGENAKECDSRVLLLERFADLTDSEGDPGARKKFFDRAVKLDATPEKARAWEAWLNALGQRPENRVVHAQLRARLLVNMAGGVMENAGLCLDRFGMPYIPGSAVKGCARRTALAALHAWCEAGGTPADKPAAEDDLLAQACVPFTDPAEMLAAIARVFGWGDADWKDTGNGAGPDFAWACEATQWPRLREDDEIGCF